MLRIELGRFSSRGREPLSRTASHPERLHGKEIRRLSVTATVWQGPRDRGLIRSHGREAPVPPCWRGRLCEGETLKKERKKCVTQKASVSGWTVNHPEAGKLARPPHCRSLGPAGCGLWQRFTGVPKPVALAINFSVYIRISLGLQFGAFINSQRPIRACLVQHSYHWEGASHIPQGEGVRNLETQV